MCIYYDYTIVCIPILYTQHPGEEIDVPSKLTLRVTAPSRRAILISAKSKRIPSELHTHTHNHSHTNARLLGRQFYCY